MSNNKSLFKSIYDFRLESFIAQRVIRFLYAVLSLLISLVTIGFCVSTFFNSDKLTFLLIPLILLGGLIYLLILRVWFEYLIVFFKIHENTEKIASQSN